MKLDAIRHLYDGLGPFASVYLNAERTSEDAATQIALRWRRLNETLEREGADPATVEAIGARLIPREETAPGRVLFATGGKVVHNEALPRPPRREIARWAPLPHVMPLLAQRRQTIPHVRVIADHTGADVMVIDEGASWETSVQAEEWPIQKTGQGGWSQRRYERGVEETWERNAMAVAETVDREVQRIGAELVVVAGEPHSRAMVCEHLGPAAAERLVVAERGSRAPGADISSFEAEAQAAVDGWLERRRAELIERFGAGPSAFSLAEVVRALRMSRVHTLLLADDPTANNMMWIGPKGDQLALEREELVAWGVDEPVRDRADAALARAVALTDAELWFVSREALGTDVGALLRY